MSSKKQLLLELLAANAKLGQPEVQRTMLMKQVFLAETVRPIYRLWSHAFSFVRYKYGPYSDSVFQQLDFLVFHGLVDIASYSSARGRKEARYRISDFGCAHLKSTQRRLWSELSHDLVWALQALGVEHVSSVSKLAYGESEFASLAAQEVQSGIGPEEKTPLARVTSANNRTFQELALFEVLATRMASSGRRSSSEALAFERRDIVRLFFIHLARQRERNPLLNRSV